MKESTNSKLLNFVVCDSFTKTKFKSKIYSSVEDRSK